MATKKCKGCGDRYEKQPDHPPFRNWCSDDCAITIARAAQELAQQKKAAKVAKDKAEEGKAFRRETASRKEALKTRGDHIKAAEKEFNRFVRLRDWALPCISCGRTDAEVKQTDGWKTGGAWDCGHFQGKGRRPELRFTETNAHRQCKSCNGGSGKYARKSHTVEQEYEIRLRARIGDAEVDRLKGPMPPAKWTIEDIKAIQTKYRLKANILDIEKGATQ